MKFVIYGNIYSNEKSRCNNSADTLLFTAKYNARVVTCMIAFQRQNSIYRNVFAMKQKFIKMPWYSELIYAGVISIFVVPEIALLPIGLYFPVCTMNLYDGAALPLYYVVIIIITLSKKRQKNTNAHSRYHLGAVEYTLRFRCAYAGRI